MKKGQIRTGIVEDVKFPNKGIVRLIPLEIPGQSGSSGKCEAGEADSGENPNKAGNEICVVKNVVPGQTLSVLVSKVRSGKGEGRVLEVLAPSYMETQSPCPHFGICGGCTWLNLPYEEQLALKEKQVRELLDIALQDQEEDWVFEPIKASPAYFGYRNKMEFTFGDEVKEGPLALGMHRRGSFYDIVSVKNCMIVDADYRRILEGTLAYFEEAQIPYFHRMSHRGFLRHLLVRKAAHTGEILVALVTTTQEVHALEGYRDMLLKLPVDGTFAGILHIENDSQADVVQCDRMNVLHGQDYFYEELLGLRFKVSVFSFFQTNSYGAEVLYQTVQEYIGKLDGSGNDAAESGSACEPQSIVYDLYSGTGTIAQLMAPVAKKVIGVEIVEEAVEAARRNAQLNNLTNCEFIAGDVLKVLDDIEEKPDFIILDPPRDGIHPKALTKIIAYGVQRMVYVSCKPTSLARDLEVLLQSGYRVEKAVAIDQFPWTANIETVCLLSNRKSKPDSHVNLSLDMEDYYRIKDQEK